MMARRILVLAAQVAGESIDGISIQPCSIVQAIESIFSEPVAYDRENGALCPFCHIRCSINRTEDCGCGAKKRYHKCPRCQRNFSSTEQIEPSRTPDPVAAKPTRRHSRSRKRRD